jgi:hypothetical protein
MFKKSVFITVLVLFAQHLTAQKSISANRKKPTIVRTQDSSLGISKATFVADKGASSASVNEIATVQAKDSLIARVKEPVKDSLIPKIEQPVKDLFSEKVKEPVKDSSSLGVKEPIKAASVEVVKEPVISKKSVPIVEKLDSIWLKTGDTLRGIITLDKDKNAFLVAYDTIQNRELRASEVVHLSISPKKSSEDRVEVFSIFNEFYFLESNPNAPIKVFANKTFKAVEDNGPKYYTTQTKYCLLKNDTPYFMNQGRVKETLLFLVNDCKAVVQGFKTGKYTTNNFIEAITHYNRCNDLK